MSMVRFRRMRIPNGVGFPDYFIQHTVGKHVSILKSYLNSNKGLRWIVEDTVYNN